MTSPLDNLASIGQLKVEPRAQGEIDGLIKSGSARLTDAEKTGLTLESRFDLAYGAAHAFSLAALRQHGYRSQSRYLVFQTLVHTIGLAAEHVRVLDKAHRQRNKTEYEGAFDPDAALVEALIEAAREVFAAVQAFGSRP
jgi:hypothetical protein